jgi:FkbM family methyltransferase
LQLIVESRQILDVAQVEVAGTPLWVRRRSRARRWDLEVVRPILEGDEYELETLKTAGHEVRTVLDIGAHIGAFTLKVKHLWPDAWVIAAEADPDNAALFCHNTTALRGISFYAGAVLGRASVREAHLRQAGRFNDDANAAASSVAEVLDELCGSFAPPTAVVNAIDVIDLLARHGDPGIDLLKLDCEGAEGEILMRLNVARRMHRIGWIRGEWHHESNLGRIEAALGNTHIYSIERGNTAWGSFRAHRMPCRTAVPG